MLKEKHFYNNSTDMCKETIGIHTDLTAHYHSFLCRVLCQLSSGHLSVSVWVSICMTHAMITRSL